MKVTEQWLRKWVNPPLSTQQLAEQLTMAGLQVDSVIPAAPEFNGVVIGHVLDVKQHPDAQRLKVCKVDVGQGEIVDIVCGGVNVRQGLKVPLAKIEAKLPGDIKIKSTKLRGALSNGMICSSKELGLGEGIEHSIMELQNDAPLGMDFRKYLELDDYIFDVELTPNRGDCLSLRGIAREMGVLNQLPVQEPDILFTPKKISEEKTISLTAKSICPRYVGRIIRNIHRNAETPVWMQERLRRTGLRCIHPVVDVCNYVMLELGQPMHAFDLEKLTGDIEVRTAKKNETLKLIDGQQLQLREGSLVIADENAVQALAGIMGGADSAVNENTQSIFLESAFFIPINISLDAQHYGLQTDSSYRFERGVDFNLQTLAIERATALLLDIVGGDAGPVTEVVSETDLPKPVSIHLRRQQISRLLGITISDEEVVRILKQLGMTIELNKEGWKIKPPSYRFDIALEVDLIEELARIYGYDHIPTKKIITELSMAKVSEQKIPLKTLQRILTTRGYHEIITYSFVDESIQKLLLPEQTALALSNPIASDMAVMRTSLWPALLQTLRYNLNRQLPRIRLFETGLCFYPQPNNECLQIAKLAMVATGGAYHEQWGQPARTIDFFDIKGDVELLLEVTGQSNLYSWKKSNHPALHPAQSAELLKNGELVGILGALHPNIVQKLDIGQEVYLFEAKLDLILSSQVPQFKEISKFPSIRRDLALVMDKNVPAADLLTTIKQNSGSLLTSIQIFDIYLGKNISEDKKSVALGLTFQDPSRTLIDTEINQLIQKLVATLEVEFNAKLRT